MRRWQVLANLIRSNGWTYGAEIGVWKGQTLFYCLDKCPDLRMIGVDSWPSSEEPHQKSMEKGISTWYPPEVIAGHREGVMEGIKKYGDRVRFLEMDSVEAANLVDNGSLDFVFIDANHSTEGVTSDVQAWLPKLRSGGTLLGHDEQWPSVRRALNELFESWNVHQDNIWSI